MLWLTGKNAPVSSHTFTEAHKNIKDTLKILMKCKEEYFLMSKKLLFKR